MPGSIVSILWSRFAVIIWASCCDFTAAYKSADHQALYPKTYSPDTIRSRTCSLGVGKEHHQVVNGSGELWPYQAFKSSPFNPPELSIVKDGRPLAPGLIFITPSNIAATIAATEDTAPIILTDAGQLVWQGPITYANNFRVASYEAKSILTYWTSAGAQNANNGHGYGQITFLDNTYTELLTVCPQLGLRTPDNTTYACDADFHESFLTDRDTLLVTAYNVTETDLSSIGGPSHGWVFDGLFFELDPKTSKVLYRWSALEHVPVSETKFPFTGNVGFNQSTPFDWFHINSVVNIGNHFLVNSRHTWTVYLITADGDIEWTLQGDTGGDFGVLPIDGHFSWQHFARPHKITESSFILSLFNNFNAVGVDIGTHPSNSLVFQLSIPPNKSDPPVVIHYLSDPNDPLYAGSQGSASLLPNGNYFVDYGQISVVKEYGVSGPNGSHVRWSARFGFNNVVQSYRGYKTEWQGFPTTRPDLVVVDEAGGGGGCRAGYVSWNGATNVGEWVVYEGWVKGRLSLVGSVGYKGFETRFLVGRPCVQVAAVVDGKVAAKSGIVCASSSNETRHA